MDPISITAALGSLKAAIDLAKSLQQTDSTLQASELKLKIAELSEALAAAKMSLLEARDEVRSLQEQLRELSSTKDLRSKLTRNKGVYYLTERVEGRDEGPYCPVCFDKDNRLISLAELPRSIRLARFRCTVCGGTF